MVYGKASQGRKYNSKLFHCICIYTGGINVRSLKYIFLAIAVMISFVGSTVNPAYSEPAGVWKLDRVEELDPGYGDRVEADVERGFATYKESREDEVFGMSFSWTEPKSQYSGGEMVELTIDAAVDSYIYEGSMGYMGGGISARIDDPDLLWGFSGSSSVLLESESGETKAEVSAIEGDIKVPSKSLAVSAPFKAGGKEGEARSIYISSTGGAVRYTYIWDSDDSKETETPERTGGEEDEEKKSKTLEVTGLVVALDDKPMPRMPITVHIYEDKDNYYSGGESSDRATVYTDIRGCFKAELEFEYEKGKYPGVMIEGEMKCVLPGDKETFYLVDMSNEDNREDIKLASFIEIGEEELEKDDEKIEINRMLSYYYIYLKSAWSFDSNGNPDALVTDAKDLSTIVEASYHYSLLWDAQFFGGVFFKEIDALRNGELRVELNWKPTEESSMKEEISHFEGTDRAIRLTEDDSGPDDLSRYTVLHEYGHYFDYATNGEEFRTSTIGPSDPEDENHGGYMNSTTDDSFTEGFAHNYCALVQRYREVRNPSVVGHWDIGAAGNYLAWGSLGKEEELAIATFLYGVYPHFEKPEDYWNIVKEDRQDFYAYYQAFEEAFKDKESAKYDLERLAESGGLYEMPFGNGRYDFGEPYKDSNGNGRYDSTEPYGDLMFRTYRDSNGNMRIDRYYPLRALEEGLKLGKVSDAGRNRRTTYKQPNSYMVFSGEVPSHLTVTVTSSQGIQSKQLVPVEEGGKLYVHAPTGMTAGEISISVPGGSSIYGMQVESYHSHIESTMGTSEPIDEIYISGRDVPVNGVFPRAIEGDYELDGHIEDLSSLDFEGENRIAAQTAENYNPSEGMEELEGGEDSEEIGGTDKRKVVLVAASVFALATLATLTLLMAKRRKSRKSKADLGGKYCRYCGNKVGESDLFCKSCGKKLE